MQEYDITKSDCITLQNRSNDLAPQYLTDLFVRLSDFHKLKNDLAVPLMGTVTHQKAFSYGWCNLHNAGCIMQVAGHVLLPRAAWLYYGAIFLVTLSFLVSGGLVSKLTLGRQKLLFCDIILVRVSYGAWNKFDN